jgi:hypothetical protein
MSKARNLGNRATEIVSVRDFGARGDGVTDDTAAIQAAFTNGGVVYFPPGTYKISSSLNLDISVAGIKGLGQVVIDASTVTDPQAINVYSTATYGQSAGLNTWQRIIEGVSFKGSAAGTLAGIAIGKIGAAYSQSHDIMVKDCGFYSFQIGVVFTDNAWRTHFQRCGFEDISSQFVFFNSPSNAGECMTFENCWMINGVYNAGMLINNGQFHFTSMSFPAGGDGGYIDIQGSAHVTFDKCNFETQPASVDHVILRAEDNTAVCIQNSTILINETDYSTPYFEINAGASLTIRNCSLPLYDYLQNEAYGVRSLVFGTSSRVYLSCNAVYGGGLTNILKWAVVSKAANMLYNGDAEVNSVAMWTVSTGGTGTFTNITTDPKTGTRHYRALSPGAGSYAEAEQKFNVSAEVAGRVIIMGMWVKQSTGTGNGFFPTINFYTENGTAISNYGAIAISNTLSSYTWIGQSTVIPAGTSVIGIKIGVNDLGAGGCTIEYDDIVVNVI